MGLVGDASDAARNQLTLPEVSPPPRGCYPRPTRRPLLRPGLLLLAGAWACGTPTFWLPANSAAMVLIVDLDRAEVPTITAHRIGEAAFKLRVAEADHRFYVLAYDTAPDLPEGPLTVSEAGLPMPSPSATYALVGDQWQPATLPSAVANLKLKELRPCFAFDQLSYQIPATTDEQPTLLLSLDGDETLLGTYSGSFFRLSPSSAIPLTELSTATPHLAGARAPDGELWLLGAQGRVVHGRLGSPFREGPPLALREGISLRVETAHESAPFELFTLTATLGVEHFDGQSWTTLRAPTGYPINRSAGRIAWLRPGAVVMLGADVDVLTEIEVGGTIREIRRPLPVVASLDAFFAAGYVDGIGALVGSRFSVVYRRTAQWDRLPSPPTNNTMLQIIPLKGGALLGGHTSEFFQWFDGFGHCPPMRVPVPYDVTYFVVQGENIYLVVPGNEGNDITVVYLSPAR